MLKPSMPNIPGMSAMTDTLEFMKNMWGGMSTPGMSIPGMVMPTLSVDEINKQIKDLKAVESWLNVNMNMLRGTIQALEVQSATISTLQSMGQTLSSAVKSGAVAKNAPAFPFPKAAVEDEPAHESEPAPTTETKRKVRNELKAEFKDAPKPAAKAAAKPKAQALSPDTASMAAPLANPAIWWNMLQDQFKQVVSAAMAPEAAAPDAAQAEAAAPPKRRAAPQKKV